MARRVAPRPKAGVEPLRSTTRPMWLDQVEAERAAERVARQREAFRRAYTAEDFWSSVFAGDR